MRKNYAIGLCASACAALLLTHLGATAAGAETYTAKLNGLNAGVVGSQAAGEAIFTIDGDQLTIAVNADGLPPNMMHLQHFHGFKDGSDARCPDSAADKNGDGLIDLIETEAYAGTTMVPFHDEPATMEIPSDSYPKADADGSYRYEKAVSLKALQAAFAEKFGTGGLDLDRRVVFIHGIPADSKLPESAASLGTIPPQVTLPIACGEIEKGK